MLQKVKLNKNEIITELGIEKKCLKCGEYWPSDEEFFNKNKKGRRGIGSYCIDCNTNILNKRFKRGIYS